MKYDNINLVIDIHINHYRKILEKQEPFSESELNAKCNETINLLNSIKNEIKILDSIEERKDGIEIVKMMNTLHLNEEFITLLEDILNAK